MNLRLPPAVRRLPARAKRQAKSLAPELARLGDVVGDTIESATSSANETARQLSRRVRRQQSRGHRRRGAVTFIVLAGIGVVVAMVARRAMVEAPGEASGVGEVGEQALTPPTSDTTGNGHRSTFDNAEAIDDGRNGDRQDTVHRPGPHQAGRRPLGDQPAEVVSSPN